MAAFAEELSRFGPDQTISVSLDDAQAYCARLTATHYENFSVVTWLTPPRLRPAFEAIYAFCRWSDDLGDEVGDPERASSLLGWWRGELRRMYKGRATHPVFVALEPVVHAFEIPIDPFEALISAFEQDQVVREYITYEQLLDYCTRSANPVGRLILYLARAYTPENVAMSDATCTALQLANFWQDVGRDLDIGRVYLPREDRDRFGYSEVELLSKEYTPAFAQLLEFEVQRARNLFEIGRPLATRLPGRLSIDVELFTRGGVAILDRIIAQKYDVLSQRPTVGKAAKLGLLARAIVTRCLPGRASREPRP